MTDASEQTRSELRVFIEENFLYMHPDSKLSDTENLLSQGIVDSLGFVELVEEVQERYGITVDDIEITEENFGSIESIASFVGRKRGG